MKATLRKEIKNKRIQLPKEYVLDRSKYICDHIVLSEIFNASKNIMCYCAAHNEADLSHILETTSKNILLPKVKNKNIVSVLYTGSLIIGKYGILEPTGDVEMTPDLVLVPAIAIDQTFHRLGYGGGYYDRFLAKHPHAYKLGVCLEEFFVETVYPQKHDVSLDAVATDKKIHYAK